MSIPDKVADLLREMILSGPWRPGDRIVETKVARHSTSARNGFDGVIIPDHTPQMSYSAPWHSGMAHTLGFIAAVLANQRLQATAPAA